jgi:hypothetical protein
MAEFFNRWLVVTGTRESSRDDEVRSFLNEHRPRRVIVGDCPTGVDAAAKSWCLENGLVPLVAHAPWNSVIGRKAGPLRNTAVAHLAWLLRNGGEEVAFVGFPLGASPGTRNSIRALMRREIPGVVL